MCDQSVCSPPLYFFRTLSVSLSYISPLFSLFPPPLFPLSLFTSSLSPPSLSSRLSFPLPPLFLFLYLFSLPSLSLPISLLLFPPTIFPLSPSLSSHSLSPSSSLHQTNLLYFVEKILSAIVSSSLSCPRLMCRIFSLLSQAAVRKFPGKPTYTRVK